MNSEPLPTPEQPESANTPPGIRSLKDLLDLVTGRGLPAADQEDAGLDETPHYPFLGLVGQQEMKLGLLISVVNPAVGGVLLIGPRGTGKTTAVRSLGDLLPQVERSACFYGCLPEDLESGGMDAVCPDCAKKYAEGRPLTKIDRVRLVELPLNARLEDVIGGLDERAAVHDRLRLKRGILSQADLNLLYVDEVNLLSNDIVDSILDAAAQGRYTVRRGPVSATYRSRFTLIGSMNPEEGRLRPQIMDRFGLRIIVRGLPQAEDRLEAYRRVREYREDPHRFAARFTDDTRMACAELDEARRRLVQVLLPEDVAQAGTAVIQSLGIDSLRAETTLFEAARALAAIDDRTLVSLQDVRTVAPLALRLRRSPFIEQYFQERTAEENELSRLLDDKLPDRTKGTEE